MANITIQDFVDRYTVRQGSEVPNSGGPSFNLGDVVYVGKGRDFNAPPPHGNSVGVSVYPAGGASGNNPLFAGEFVFQGGTLQHLVDGPSTNYRVQFSLYKAEQGGYKALYGVVVQVDPEQVGVVGADNGN